MLDFLTAGQSTAVLGGVPWHPPKIIYGLFYGVVAAIIHVKKATPKGKKHDRDGKNAAGAAVQCKL